MPKKGKTKTVDATAEKGEQTASVTAAAQPQPNNNQTIKAKAKAKTKEVHTFSESDRALFQAQEKVIASNQGAFLVLGEALHLIKKGNLHEISHPDLDFDEYCSKKWGFGQQYAYRLMAAYLCVKNLKDALTPKQVTTFPVNESQVRHIAGLDPEEQVKVWSTVLEKANGQTITAKLVEESAGGGSTNSGAETSKTTSAEATDPKAQKAEAKANTRKLAQILKAIEKFKKTAAEDMSIKFLQEIITKIEEIVVDSKD